MVHPRHSPEEGPPKLPDVDDYLTPEQETQLRTSTARVAWEWQRAHGCANFDCIRCRVGRALAVLSKGLMDCNAAADVLCGLIPDLVEYRDEVVPPPNVQSYEEVCHILLKTLDALESCGVTMARAMGTPASPGTGMTFDRDVN